MNVMKVSLCYYFISIYVVGDITVIPLKEMLLTMDGLSGMIGLFSLCSAQDRVVRPQNHITPSAPGCMIEALQIEPHCIVSC